MTSSFGTSLFRLDAIRALLIASSVGLRRIRGREGMTRALLLSSSAMHFFAASKPSLHKTQMRGGEGRKKSHRISAIEPFREKRREICQH